MRKFNQFILVSLLFLNPIFGHAFSPACEPSEYLSKRAEVEKTSFKGLYLYIWKQDSTYAFALLFGRDVPIPREIIARAPVYEQCQIELFLTDLKAQGEVIIVYLIRNPNNSKSLRLEEILDPDIELMDVIAQLENVASSNTNIKDFYVRATDKTSNEEIFEMFR